MLFLGGGNKFPRVLATDPFPHSSRSLAVDVKAHSSVRQGSLVRLRRSLIGVRRGPLVYLSRPFPSFVEVPLGITAHRKRRFPLENIRFSRGV